MLWPWLSRRQDVSSLSSVPREDEACVAMAAPEHTQDVKNEFPVKVSSCLENGSFFLLGFHTTDLRAAALRSWIQHHRDA